MADSNVIHYRAVHEKAPWRSHHGHETLSNALEGPLNGAPALFAHRARVDYAALGEPLFVVIWREGDVQGFVVRADQAKPNGTTYVKVAVPVLQGYDMARGAPFAALESHFRSKLASLLPAGREAVMDLVARAGVNVEAWHYSADQRPVDNPRANPHYCYDWSFGSAAEGFILCLWHGDLDERDDRIVSDNGVGSHRKLLEELRDEAGIDGARRSRLNQQIRRAREFEEAIEQSWRRSMPLRVIINAGRQRLREEIADASSRVDLRALDDQPWYVHAHDAESQRWLLVRGDAPGARESDSENEPSDDDTSPGADDARRVRTIKVRRGQSEFRSALLGAYDGKCAVTGSRIKDLLEAAHIVPHAQGTNYRVSNGILLRADIHTLYDLHLLSIDERYRVHLSKLLQTSEYLRYHGKDLLALPSTSGQQPSAENLRARHERFLAVESQRTA